MTAENVCFLHRPVVGLVTQPFGHLPSDVRTHFDCRLVLEEDRVKDEDVVKEEVLFLHRPVSGLRTHPFGHLFFAVFLQLMV